MTRMETLIATLAVILIIPVVATAGKVQPPSCEKPVEIIKANAEVIGLDEAIDLAFSNSPELYALCQRAKAAEKAMKQEALIPNPELEFEIEEFGGTGEFEEGESGERTFMLSQELEMGKRGRRKEVGTKELNTAVTEYELGRLRVAREVKFSFYRVAVMEKKVSLMEERVEAAELVHNAVSARVRAGKVSPVEEKKSEVALSEARIALADTRRELDSARLSLSVIWGSEEPEFESVRSDLTRTVEPSGWQAVAALLEDSPALVLSRTEVETRKAELELERWRSIPNVTLGFGLKSYEATDDTAYVAAASVPVPIFDRNQGAKGEALYRLKEGEAVHNSTRLMVRRDLFSAYQSLVSSYEGVKSLEKDVLPSAESVYSSTEQGYRAGKFDYLELLDSQERLFQAREEYLSRLYEYHEARATVDYLTGSDIYTDNDTLKENENEG